MLCSNVILQFAFVLVILIGVQMLHTGEINILYFLGYVLASIKVRGKRRSGQHECGRAVLSGFHGQTYPGGAGDKDTAGQGSDNLKL